jgi:hypothetical protein
MRLGTPQIIWLALIFLGLGIDLAKHGEPRSNTNFWTTLISSIIAFLLLKAGGFFG